MSGYLPIRYAETEKVALPLAIGGARTSKMARREVMTIIEY